MLPHQRSSLRNNFNEGGILLHRSRAMETGKDTETRWGDEVHGGCGHVRDKCRALFIVPRLTRSSFDDPVFLSEARSPGFVIASNVVDRVGTALDDVQHVLFDHFVIFVPLPAARRSCSSSRLLSSWPLVSFPLPRFPPAIRTRSREEGNDVPRITKPARRT